MKFLAMKNLLSAVMILNLVLLLLISCINKTSSIKNKSKRRFYSKNKSNLNKIRRNYN